MRLSRVCTAGRGWRCVELTQGHERGFARWMIVCFDSGMNALEELLSDLKEVCAGLDDKRVGPGYRYTMADIGLAAFSVFFLQSPSFLGHQRTLAEGHGRSNCQTLFGMAAIPSDNHIRQMLDGNSPAVFDRPFIKAMESVAAAMAFRRSSA